MRNSRVCILTVALGLVVGSPAVLSARAGGAPTGGVGVVGAPVSAWGGGQPVAGPGYGYGGMSGGVPNGLTMDIFCGQGGGYCNQRYQLMRRWSEHRYVKHTGARYIPIDPYGARLSMSGPDFAYPEGARVISSPQPAATAAGADPAVAPPAAPSRP